MTKNAGMEEFYDKMGAVTPEEASKPLADFVEKLDMSMSGKFWAPRKFSSGRTGNASGRTGNESLFSSVGARGIGNAEEVLGKEVLDKPGPLEIPW